MGVKKDLVTEREVDNFNRRTCRPGLFSCIESALHCMQLTNRMKITNSDRVRSKVKFMTEAKLGKYISLGKYTSESGFSNYNFSKFRANKFTNSAQFAISVLLTLFSVGYRLSVAKFHNRIIWESVLQSISRLISSRQILRQSVNSTCILESKGSLVKNWLNRLFNFKPACITEGDSLKAQVKILKFKLSSSYFNSCFNGFDSSKADSTSTAYLIKIKKSLSLLTLTFSKWIQLFKWAPLTKWAKLISKQVNCRQFFGEALRSRCGSALLITVRSKELPSARFQNGKRSFRDELTLIAGMFNLKVLPSRP